MPKVTIWIREGEDYKKWQAIKNKPQWITTALNTSLVEMAINQDIEQYYAWRNRDIPKPDLPIITINSMGRDLDIISPETIEKMTKKRISPAWCKEHDMEKHYCANMKHTVVK